MKSLVVYYSFTGKTRLVAQAVAEALNAALVEIEERRPIPMPFVYLSGSFAAFMNRGSRIKPVDIDVKQYERVFIGSLEIEDDNSIVRKAIERLTKNSGVVRQ